MKTVSICKAQGIPRVNSIEPVTIVIEREFPEYKALSQSAEHFEKDADALVGAILTTLPGGTIDRLICKLLQKKASLFVVPLFNEKKPDEGGITHGNTDSNR
ncbi:MAG: hypothetical protein C4586_08625 [Anaerolineaceae bacterium]|nr:MAG: hypothetical protein C4586_08625 [Anaerolineaceae bacterium]